MEDKKALRALGEKFSIDDEAMGGALVAADTTSQKGWSTFHIALLFTAFQMKKDKTLLRKTVEKIMEGMEKKVSLEDFPIPMVLAQQVDDSKKNKAKANE